MPSGHPITPIVANLSPDDWQALQSAGLTVEELVRAAAEVIRQSQITTAVPVHALSEQEEEFLKHAGAKGVGEHAPGAIARNVAAISEEYAELLKTAHTGKALANVLGVTPGRISQRAAKGALYGMMGPKGAVLYPAFQVIGDKLLPGLEQVIEAIPQGANVVAVARFFSHPHPDLITPQGALSPRDWLLAGNEPARVADLARDIVGAI